MFEAYDDKVKRVFFTYDKDCVPNKTQIDSMAKGEQKK